MRRRDFLAVLGSAAAAWPLAGHAQQPTLPVVGLLMSGSADGYASLAAAFRQGLKEAGYVEGHNVQIEYRWAEDHYDHLPSLATDLVNRRVAVIFVNHPSIAAAKAVTTTIPIVFFSGDDPVRLGFVESFNRPGGNLTGVTIWSSALAAKRLQVLYELIPNAKIIAVLINPDYGGSRRFLADAEAAARALGVSIRPLEANNEREIKDAFGHLAQVRADALLVGPGPFLYGVSDLVVMLAARIAIPAAYESRPIAAAGGLMSYGLNVGDGFREAGIYAGRILKGDKPADLPVQTPNKYELVINLKTAKALGLQVPGSLLARADEVIE
jgi:ABC-type uncharacterized transport system substrate-binding protein